MRLLLVPILLGLATVACASQQRGADADWSPEPQQKDKRFRETEALNAAQPLNEPKTTALLGVRHDLMLGPEPHEARCSCLSVELGRPADKRFFWAGGAPDIPADSVVIAVGSRGITCPGGDPDDKRRRPSISAVDQEDGDIIVEIEDLPPGRPLASGAIIPRPMGKGSIYIRPHKNNRVYGRNPGVQRCRVQ